MPTSGRYSKSQFGQSIYAGMGPASSAYQQLHLYVGTQNKKQLTHISMASYSDASPINTGQRLYRVIVCSGNVPINETPLNVLDMSPIATEAPNVKGVNRVFLDQVYVGSVEIDFDEPIIVGPEEQLNFLMALSYANADGILTPSTSIGRIAWQGWEGEQKTSEFPYRLR